jgi:hypothetical protein
MPATPRWMQETGKRVRARRRCAALHASVRAAVAAGALHVGSAAAVEPASPAPPAEAPFSLHVGRRATLGSRFAYATLGVSGSLPADAPSTLSVIAGGGVGVVEPLSSGALGSLDVAPQVRYRTPQRSALDALADAPLFALDVTAHLAFGPVRSALTAKVEPGVTVLLRTRRVTRDDRGERVLTPTDDRLNLGLRLPLSLALQLGGGVSVAVNAGVVVDDVRRPARSASVPVGVSASWSVPVGRGGTIGLTPSITWPTALLPQATPAATVVALTLSVESRY